MLISAIIIAKNAQDLITDCLKSVSFCDETIVVDAESTDKTREIAKKTGAKVFRGVENDFAKQRAIGLEAAKGEWVLYVDTDERVSPLLREEIIKSVKNSTIQYQVFRVKRKNFYFGNHEWPYIEKLERLFKKEKLKGWQGKLHESPIVHGKAGELDGYLLHYTHRDLSTMIEKTLVWSKVEAELRFENNHPQMTWWRFPRVMFTGFYDSYIRQSGWKAGTVGIIESIYQAFSMFITYARLWEMQEKFKNQK